MKITDVRRARIALDPTASPMLSILCAAAATHEQSSSMACCFLVKRGYPLILMLTKSLTIVGYQAPGPKRLSAAQDYIFSRLEFGALVPVIDRTFQLD